jgi:hypothetical protein
MPGTVANRHRVTESVALVHLAGDGPTVQAVPPAYTKLTCRLAAGETSYCTGSVKRVYAQTGVADRAVAHSESNGFAIETTSHTGTPE